MDAIIERYKAEPFVWGKTDCCRFVCECVASITGVDLSEKFDWHDHVSATALVDSYGSLYELVCAELGPTSLFYKDGDVCMTYYCGQQILGVIKGNKGLFRTEAGIIERPVASVAWHWST